MVIRKAFSINTFKLGLSVLAVLSVAPLAIAQKSIDFSNATISTSGFGDLKIGMSQDEAQRIIGEPLRRFGSSADASCFFHPASNERLVLRIKQGKLVSVDTSSPQVGVTRSGIRVGESSERVRATYSKDSSYRLTKSPFDQRPVTVVGASANQVALAMTDGKVDLIRVGVASDLWGRCE